MSEADEALADVRRWLCDNLGEGDAGKVCGMLSVVSRRISELEEENAKRNQAAYESLSEENDQLDQKRTTLLHKVDQLNSVIRRQRKQLTEVQEAMRKRNADNRRLKQVSEKLFRTVNHFCTKGYPCIACPLCREEAPCELVKSYFALKELGCDVRP